MNDTIFPGAQGQSIIYACNRDVTETTAIIEQELADKGIPAFARFDHDKNAAGVNLELRPTRVIVFGAPAVGTLLMHANQSVALELPLRVAVWETPEGQVYLATQSMDSLAAAYGLEGEPALETMRSLLYALATKAAGIDS